MQFLSSQVSVYVAFKTLKQKPLINIHVKILFLVVVGIKAEHYS